MTIEKLLTLAQAADQSGCSVKTLRRAMASGHLVAVRLGEGPKSDRIHPDDLAAFWASRRTTGALQVPPPTLQVTGGADDACDRLQKLLGPGAARPTRRP
ncbi:helix-turn-helix domain-containing protein [Luteimonas terrae]|uniref:Excisionase family DNA binding protein n=1 Tax=Luteimonas terrae TaxID=1530191 RepID=A0ABU1XVE2_9GAMM|nr:helix-turn-helix domain-containing protein [Luteimonas terrae]MDR7192719.1 excisionase family DNA binding protein [Luteimonas terrae]